MNINPSPLRDNSENRPQEVYFVAGNIPGPLRLIFALKATAMLDSPCHPLLLFPEVAHPHQDPCPCARYAIVIFLIMAKSRSGEIVASVAAGGGYAVRYA